MSKKVKREYGKYLNETGRRWSDIFTDTHFAIIGLMRYASRLRRYANKMEYPEESEVIKQIDREIMHLAISISQRMDDSFSTLSREALTEEGWKRYKEHNPDIDLTNLLATKTNTPCVKQR